MMQTHHLHGIAGSEPVKIRITASGLVGSRIQLSGLREKAANDKGLPA